MDWFQGKNGYYFLVLACLLGLNGLRVSEACGADITDLDGLIRREYPDAPRVGVEGPDVRVVAAEVAGAGRDVAAQQSHAHGHDDRAVVSSLSRSGCRSGRRTGCGCMR